MCIVTLMQTNPLEKDVLKDRKNKVQTSLFSNLIVLSYEKDKVIYKHFKKTAFDK